MSHEHTGAIRRFIRLLCAFRVYFTGKGANNKSRLGSVTFTGGADIRVILPWRGLTDRFPFWAGACQQLWLVGRYDVY